MFIVALFTIANIWKQSVHQWMDKEDVILLSHKKEYHSAIKKKEGNLAIYDNMDRPRGCYAKWNESERGRQIPYDFTYMWNLKNKRTNTTEIDS